MWHVYQEPNQWWHRVVVNMLWLSRLRPSQVSSRFRSQCLETSFKMTQLGCQGNWLDEALAGFGRDYIRPDQLGRVKSCPGGEAHWGYCLFSFRDKDIVVTLKRGCHGTPTSIFSIQKSSEPGWHSLSVTRLWLPELSRCIGQAWPLS